MEYLTVAYFLIAAVLTAYTISIRQRAQAVRHERELLESREN